MSRMTGLELRAIGRSSHVDLTYEGGDYVDTKGRPVEGLLDLQCYACLRSFYTLSEEAVSFCPLCGHMEGAFPRYEDLIQRLSGQDWSFLSGTGALSGSGDDLKAFAAQTREGWRLAFATSARDLDRRGDYHSVRELS